MHGRARGYGPSVSQRAADYFSECTDGRKRKFGPFGAHLLPWNAWLAETRINVRSLACTGAWYFLYSKGKGLGYIVSQQYKQTALAIDAGSTPPRNCAELAFFA